MKLLIDRNEPLLQFFITIDILNRLHRYDVTTFLKRALNVAAHSLSRRVVKHHGRCRFKCLQLLELHVKLIVRHRRIILNIILIACPGKCISQTALILNIALSEFFYRVHICQFQNKKQPQNLITS